MDSRLFRAAQLGNVESLLALLDEDPIILEKSALAPTAETPLHIAAIAGKSDFVREIIIRKPCFAWKLNQEGLSPLHIAAAIGYEDVVQELLSFGNRDDVGTHTYHENSSRFCLLKDKQGLIPLHYAALKGEVTVIEELVRCCPESLKELTARGQTVLHLAVKNSQFEAFKTLVDKLKGDDVKYFVDSEDDDGNKIYEMAVDSKQLQIVQYLKSHTNVGINSIEICCESGDIEQGDQFKKTLTNTTKSLVSEDMLLVVGSFIATVTFQTAISPPGTFSKGDFDILKNCRGKWSGDANDPCKDSMMFFSSMVFNTASFFAATYLLILRRVPWIPFLLSTAIVFMLMTYVSLLFVIYPRGTVALVYICGLAMVMICPISAYRLFLTAQKSKRRFGRKMKYLITSCSGHQRIPQK